MDDWRCKVPRQDSGDQFTMNINTGPRAPASGKAESTSFGVACCRIKDGKPEILIICKRNTYAYRNFVHAVYNIKNNSDMIKMFSQMTLDEKLEILSLNFSQIWYRAWFNQTKGKSYFRSKTRFVTNFLQDGGKRLKGLISKSSNSIPIWEIPKGKKDHNETDIVASMREFYEETGIRKHRYKIFPMRQNIYSYIDAGVRYRNVYYTAICEDIPAGVNNALQEQLYEIADCKWMNMEALRQVDTHNRLTHFVKHIFKFVKNQ